jgi:DNA-binding NarL/FixJ family response regulator
MVVDDHPLFREALIGLLEQLRVGRIVAAASAEDGLRKLHGSEVGLVLLNLGLPGIAGANAVAMFRQASHADIVVVSGSRQRRDIDDALRAGARAVISKCASMPTLREVLRQAVCGELDANRWYREQSSSLFGERVMAELTPRQQEIAALLLSGHSNKEIGRLLGLAEITVKTHLTALFRRLHVSNRLQAVMAIRRLEFGAPPAALAGPAARHQAPGASSDSSTLSRH